MTILMKIFLCVDVVLLALLVGLIIVKTCAKKKEESAVEEVAVAEDAPQEEVVAEEPVVTEEAVVEEVALQKEELVVGDLEDPDDDREAVRKVPFAEKMLNTEVKNQEYYNELNNFFHGYRNINIRVSSKGVSYRNGRELVSKIIIRGKTIKLFLALDVNKFDNNVYFQRDSKDVKAYAEVPFTVKVKSDRGLKNAKKLIEAMCEEKGIEKKVRVNPIDSMAILKVKLSEYNAKNAQ